MSFTRCLGFTAVALSVLLCKGAAIAADGGENANPPDNSSYILTPPAPHSPRINGTNIYGERPNHPFLYTIPATGDRPMIFSANGLPEGLTLDSTNGRINGSVAKPGTYHVILRAKNDLGANNKRFNIVIGDSISLTPPMGWNTYNCWGWDVNQHDVVESAQAMVAKGLDQHGWTYICTDDTWQGTADPVSHAMQGNSHFPDMKGMTDQIHGLGFKAGIYSTPWIESYAGYPGGTSNDSDRKLGPDFKNSHQSYVGKYSFVDADAKQWAAWGFDYLKYDWHPIDVEQVELMESALKNSGRDMVFSLSNTASFEHAADYAAHSNLWRTTDDITDNYESMAAIGFNQTPWAPYCGPGHWNDPDMMVIGWCGWGHLHPSPLSADEQYTHVSLWCLLSAPLILGCSPEKLDNFTLSLITNDEVLAIDQDSLGKSATQVATSGGDVTLTGLTRRTTTGDTSSVTLPRLQVWAKPLADGSTAVGLFNLGPDSDRVTASFESLNIKGKYRVRDLWRQKDIGKFSGSFGATVPSHGVVLLKFTRTK